MIVVLCLLFFSVQRHDGMFGNVLMLVRSSAARAVRRSTRTATTGVRVLLEQSVARVLLSVAAAAADCSCSWLHGHKT